MKTFKTYLSEARDDGLGVKRRKVHAKDGTKIGYINTMSTGRLHGEQEHHAHIYSGQRGRFLSTHSSIEKAEAAIHKATASK